jgi:hypothetical protein
LLGNVRQKNGDARYTRQKGAFENEWRHAPSMLLGGLPASIMTDLVYSPHGTAADN